MVRAAAAIAAAAILCKSSGNPGKPRKMQRISSGLQPDGSMVRCDCFTRPTSNIQQAGARVGSEASLGLV